MEEMEHDACTMSRRGGTSTGANSVIFLLTNTNGELLEDEKFTPMKESSSSSSSSKPMIRNKKKFGELFCALALVGIFLAITMIATTTSSTSTKAGQVNEKKNPAVEALTAHSPYPLVSFSSLPSNSNVSSNVSRCPGPEHRCAPLHGDKSFNVIRIPKCASVSLLTEVAKIWSKNVKAFEQTPRYSFRKFNSAKYFFSSVKSPRHHVWSLFSECKYDMWFIRHREWTFPAKGKREDGDMRDFETWLDYFVEARPVVGGNTTGNHSTTDYEYQVNRTQLKDYKCYHPSNFIARYFSVNYREAHHVVDKDHKEGPFLEPGMDVFEPPVEAWNETFWKLDVVFVADLFLESKCLFYYRSLLANSAKVNNTHLQEFLDTSCRCHESNTNETTTEPSQAAVVHVIHHAEGHRASMRDGVPARVLAKIEALTRVDVQLYKMALVEKLKQLVWLESPSQLGRRVVCTKKLEQLDYEMEYLNFGSRISELYYHLKSL